jgi:DNA-binding MarR family transcriptional regulator
MKNTNHVIALISNIRDNANKLIISKLEDNGVKGLAPTHGSILQALYHTNKSLTMQDISIKINRDKSTVTALVNKLENLGYIEKLKNQEDSRITIIVLSKQGWDLKPIFDDISSILLACVYKDFSQDEKEVLIKSLEKINENI